jgi:hypothetical protein
VQKTEIAKEILAYLVDHPDAQDTFEGIIQWWLPEQEIKFQIEKVKEALEELVDKQLILECKSGDSRTHYRMNKNKSREIQAFFRERSE